MTVLTLSTFIKEGHAFAHKLQSMQVPVLRLILDGLNNETIPSKAPYGHRYLHQKFLKNIESKNSDPITIKLNRDKSAKK
jgi:hypothetical protein